MQKLTFNTILVFLVLGACLLSIFPIEENLRLGKDLAGGVTLTYTVDVKSDDPSDVVDRTINVLKDRVNPQGLYEISMVQQGRDRIEISMPLPNEKVRKLRADYDEALKNIDDFAIDADAFQRDMRLSGAERLAALEKLADTAGRRALLQPVIDAVGKAESARNTYEAALPVVTDQAELTRLLEAAGSAEVELEAARDKVLASLVSSESFRSAMELPAKGHTLRDPETKEEISLPSPRETAIESIRQKIGGLPGGAEATQAVLQKHEVYAKARRGFDDPSELMRLLQGAGVLEFRIAIRPGGRVDESELRKQLRERGPDNVSVDGAGWYRLNDIQNWFKKPDELRAVRDDAPSYFSSRYGTVVEEYNGRYYMLLHDVPGKRITKAEGDWALARALVTSDELGRPAVGFRMDPRGASLMGALTEGNLQQPMAIVLDGQVYSSATIQSRISADGQISGNFRPEDINYLIKTLNAGSLTARLGSKPLSQSVLAPELGADNLKKGLEAAWIAFIAITVFMISYYFFSGGVAIVAILANAIMILGIMALQKAAFTLPGIAGVVLTFGTAVDANVLIYERIREELLAGNDVRNAVRIAFKRVGTTIVDANLTNLIVCLVLVYTGTQEIKGFGITLGIGVVATLFCAMVVTRLIFVLFVDRLKGGLWTVSQLPYVWPGLQRALTPNVDWMRLFPVFVVISTVLVGSGLAAVFLQGNRMLDSEFRGGTSITLQLKQGAAGTSAAEPMTLTRAEVKERIDKVVVQAEAEKSPLTELKNAEIVPINPRSDGVTSDRFTLRTTLTDEQLLRTAVVGAFSDVVESNPALTFVGSNEEEVASAPVYEVLDPRLGANFGSPEIENDVAPYLGGAAIVLRDIEPRPTRENLIQRLELIRTDAAYSIDALRREFSLIVLEGDASAVQTAAIVVHDARVNLFEDKPRWVASFAAQEWKMVREALTVPTVLAGVNTFEPAIARTFRAQAITAVVLSFILISIYVWVRFGSVRYSLAAVVPLVHDTLSALGLVALAEILYENTSWAASIGLTPIKIDLGLVAAIMTIIGYSLNDTIVILDRVRENRGKLAYASKTVINDSINQTMSRTFITAGTALVSLIVLFLYGGEGIASFAYTMACGMIVGTYSTVAIAAPIVYTRKIPPAAPGQHAEEAVENVRSLPAGV